LGATGVIGVILFVGFVGIFTDNTVECEKMNKNLYDQQLAFNQSAEHYRYRANTLEGEFDLPGDLAAWRNHLLNELNRIQHNINVLEDKCQS
jgi:hypothetical protein